MKISPRVMSYSPCKLGICRNEPLLTSLKTFQAAAGAESTGHSAGTREEYLTGLF